MNVESQFQTRSDPPKNTEKSNEGDTEHNDDNSSRKKRTNFFGFNKGRVKANQDSKIRSGKQTNEVNQKDEIKRLSGKDEITLRFVPEKILASPAWDMWSFGLLMVQLLHSRCIYLPNFEKARDALLRNMFNYDRETAKVSFVEIPF